MRRRIFLFLLLLAPFAANAGAGDTLETYFKKIPRDSSGVRLLIDASDEIALVDVRTSVRLVEEALAIAKETGNRRSVRDAMYTLGVRHMNQGDYVKASGFLFPALALSDSLGDDEGRLRSLNSIGNLYAHQDQLAAAAPYYEKALALARKTKNRTREGIIVGNLGNIYYMQSQGEPQFLDKSLEYYNAALAIAEEYRDTIRQITVLNNMAMLYGDKKMYGEALRVLDRVMGMILLQHDSADLVFAYANYGRVYRDKEEYDKAIESFTRALNTAQLMNYRDMVAENYRSLAICYELKGDFTTAYRYQVLHTQLGDSLINATNTGIITDLKNKIENERRENEINELKQKNEIADLAGSRQNLYLAISIGGLVALGGFAFLLFNRARVKERANQQLGNQNLIIAQKNKDITDSINYARRIQESLLASENEMTRFLPDFFIFFRPRDIVSGDFWWITKKEEQVFLCVADCTGHGVPGAFMSLLCISFLNEAVTEKGIQRPDEVFNYVRSRIIASLGTEGSSGNSDGMDGVLCRFDPATLRLSFACANNPLWIIRDGQLIEHKGDKMPVGKFHGEIVPFRLQEVQLQKGDTVYLLSDGYADQFGGASGKKFMYRKLKELLLSNAALPMQEQSALLDRTFYGWKGNLEQVDDVLVTGFRV